MNYNTILNRLINTIAKKKNSNSVFCFNLYKNMKPKNCDCVDYCKYGPTPNVLYELKFEENKKISLENF
jgi:hypothetical protein